MKWWVFLVGVEPYGLQVGTYPMSRDDIIGLLATSFIPHNGCAWAFMDAA